MTEPTHRTTKPDAARGRARAVAAALVAAAGLAAAVWLLSEPTRVPDARARPAPEAAPAAPRTEPALDAAPAEPAAPVAETPAPLDALLVATVVRPDAARSFAALSRLDGTDTQLVAVGEVLPFAPNARLTVVGDGFADVEHDGRTVRLTAASRLDPLAERFLEAVRNSPPREPSEEEKARRRAFAERMRARMDAGPGSGHRVSGSGVLSDARTVTLWDGDRLDAVELQDVEPGGLYDELGFTAGDRIRSIGGVAVGDPDAAAHVLRALVNGDELLVDVERNGEVEQVPVSPDDVLPELQRRFPWLTPEDLELLDGIDGVDLDPSLLPSNEGSGGPPPS